MVAPRSRAQASTTLVGWRHEIVLDEPGPPPRRPAPTDQERVSEEWIDGQRRMEAHTNRPLKYVLYALAGVAALCVLLWPVRVLPGILVLGAFLACLAIALPILLALLQSRQVMRDRVAAQQRRVEQVRASREQELRARQEEHARAYTEWQGRKRAYEAQPHWYGVPVPDGVDTVLVSGGTDPGWSALLTTLGASLLRGGGDLTVVDLTGRAVTADLTSLAEQCGVASKLWVLPADLTTMHLGTNLTAGQRARVLAAVARASDPKADPDADQRLLLGIFEVVGAQARVSTLTSALRALAEPDSTRADDPALRPLSAEQIAQVRERCGAEDAVAERAWELERHLAPFEGIGTRAIDHPYAQVKVIATDRVSGEVAARAFGTYTLAALSELLDLRSGSATDATTPWARSVVVCGADALPGAVVERAIRAARGAGVGLVLTFRENGDDESAVPRFADDGCLTVVMRQPGTRAAARMASQMFDGEPPAGADQRDVARDEDTTHDDSGGAGGRPPERPGPRLHRLTEVLGEALRDTVADGEHRGSSSNPAEAETTPVTVRPKAKTVAPLDLVRHVRAATSWGRATTQASEIDSAHTGGSAGVRTVRLDALGLRTLPPTAMILPGDDGLILADANPGILTLPTATLGTVEEARAGMASVDAPPDPDDGPPPNLGPPPERLDWRTP